MNDRRADQLKIALRHQASKPVSDAVRKREMDEVRNYNRRQQQKVFNFERQQANAYQQDQKDPEPQDVGNSFKLQQYVSKLNTLLQQKQDIFNQLLLALPQMDTPLKLRGATSEARGTSTFLSRAEIMPAFNDMMFFIASSFQDINSVDRVRQAVYQQYLTPLTALFRETATLYPQFVGQIPAPRGRQADFNIAKASVKDDAEDSYAMMRVMADYIEDGIFRPVTQKDIDTRKKEDQVGLLFDSASQGQPPPQAPPFQPVGPAAASILPQNVQPPPMPPPTRDEIAKGITAEEAAARAAAPAYVGPPAPPALNPAAAPFVPGAPVGPAPIPVPAPAYAAIDVGTAAAPTGARLTIKNAIFNLQSPRRPNLPSPTNLRSMTTVANQVLIDNRNLVVAPFLDPADANAAPQMADAVRTIYTQEGLTDRDPVPANWQQAQAAPAPQPPQPQQSVMVAGVDIGTPGAPTEGRRIFLAALGSLYGAVGVLPQITNDVAEAIANEIERTDFLAASAENYADPGQNLAQARSQAKKILAKIYEQNNTAPGAALPADLTGFGNEISDAEEEGEEDEGEDESAYLPMPGVNTQEDFEKLFTPQAYDPKNPMMYMGNGAPSGGGRCCFNSKMCNGTKAYRFKRGEKSANARKERIRGGDWLDTIASLRFNTPDTDLLAQGLRMANPNAAKIYDGLKGMFGGQSKISGGCADCGGSGRARHRTAPTKRYMINGLPQGVASRLSMFNPDSELMDVGLDRLKGIKVPTSDELLQARGIINEPYPEQPYYGYGIDGDDDETGNLTGLKQRLTSGIMYGNGRNHRADNMLSYDPVLDDVYENTGADEELAGEGYIREEYEEPKDMDEDPNPFRVRQENYRIATGKQKHPTYKLVK